MGNLGVNFNDKEKLSADVWKNKTCSFDTNGKNRISEKWNNKGFRHKESDRKPFTFLWQLLFQ